MNISVADYKSLLGSKTVKNIRIKCASPTKWDAKGFLDRLMSVPRLGQVNLGPEDHLAIEFARHLRAWTIDGRLKAVWTHVANELAGGSKNARIRYAIAKNLGLASGISDYIFMWSTGSLALEAKAPGKIKTQSNNQKDFAEWCAEHHVPYAVFDSIDLAVNTMIEVGILDASCLADIARQRAGG